jgi:hypothetical protein
MLSKRALLFGAAGLSIDILPAHAIIIPSMEEDFYKPQKKGKHFMLNRFFLDCNKGIPPLRVKRLVDTHGTNILIGIDPGSKDTPDEDSMLTVKSVK